MKKRYELENLDCAACAAKLEDALGKLPGVEAVTVSFLTQKLTVTAADETFDAVMQTVAETVKKVEPECVLHWK